MKSVNIGICGFGTVGRGVYELLEKNSKLLYQRLGIHFVVEQIAIRRELDIETSASLTNDVFAVARNPSIDVVVEVIGGTDTAFELVLESIEQGKHVVTANKALIATHGKVIMQKAKEKGVIVAYEAAVAGGIPIIKVLQEALVANKTFWLAGIINGTCNYILSEMSSKLRDFSEVLKEAQELGYAEADPTFDIEGIDGAHKLAILAADAFSVEVDFNKLYVEGITQVSLADIQFAKELGYVIKHLGIAKKVEDTVEVRIHPVLISKDQALAQVNGVMNAVMVASDALGESLYYGAGAGALPTASAVVADIAGVGSGAKKQSQALAAFETSIEANILPIEKITSAYYLRISVIDNAGVMSAITSILSANRVSIDAVMQKEVGEGKNTASIIMLTHPVAESYINKAICDVESLPELTEPLRKIRVEHFVDETLEY